MADTPSPEDLPAKRRNERRTQRVEASPRFRDGKFWNTAVTPMMSGGPSLGMLADFAFGQKKRSPHAAIPVLTDTRERLVGAPEGGLRLTWLSHSTVLIEIDGMRLLTDPVWGMRASPWSFAGPVRYHPMPLQLSELGRIDAILLSHDHYDHLCADTWRQLARGAAPGWSGKVLTPLGVGAHLEALDVQPAGIVELDWGEGHKVGDVEIVAVPARHFSGRGALDRNRTLWAGFAMLGPTHRVFFSGDTGPTPEHLDIAASLGPFDVVLFEIGAWNEAWANIHLGPEKAFETFAQMSARAFLPIHWGTFDLGLHPWAEPAETLYLRAQAEQANVWQPRPGEPIVFARQAELRVKPWWRAVG